MTPKNIHKIFIPQKIFIFLKTLKNIEIQNFDPKKMVRAYVCMKISEYPPGTKPRHCVEELHNNHETPGRQTKQSNLLSLPHEDDCKSRMDIK